MTDDLGALVKEWKVGMAAADSLPLDQLLKLADRLISAELFPRAREILRAVKLRTEKPQSAEETNLRVRAAQKMAVSTYKDPQLPLDERFDRALEELTEIHLDKTTDQETLGPAGAICKRLWEVDGQIGHLHRALEYYRRGWQQGIEGDNGYTAINAAFVLDQLAAVEQQATSDAQGLARAWREQADDIRREIVAKLSSRFEGSALEKPGWWPLATLMEAHVGLGQDSEAGRIFKAYKPESVSAWQVESTVSQLMQLVRCRHDGKDLHDCQAWLFLKEHFPDEAGTLDDRIGKVGLALSGGGFRAALFHIGVLARLAELDLLRHVEVLSCVSGGSILGSHYYLKLRHLLQSKEDKQITRQDYIDIVRDIEINFLDGVQRNIRTMALAHPRVNLHILFNRDGYTLTDRIGELLDRYFLCPLPNQPPLRMRDVHIRPLGQPNFAPHRDNWRRRSKVPMLILNATSLNTGHAWQFTSSWMGESRTNVSREIDANSVFTPIYFDEVDDNDEANKDIPPAQRQTLDLPFGKAVASSACVPPIFTPTRITKVYPDDASIALVDGAIHDNQGTSALLTEGCNVIIASDAAGQIATEGKADIGPMSVLKRCNFILQERVREARYRELSSRHRAGTLKLAFLHLAKDLRSPSIDWLRHIHLPASLRKKAEPTVTTYKMSRTVQRLLLNIRTDLDSFSDIEAFALMYSGYQMATHQLREQLPELKSREPETLTNWTFLCIGKRIDGSIEDKEINDALRRGATAAFRFSRLLPRLAIGCSAALLVAAAMIGWHFGFGKLLLGVGIVAAGILFPMMAVLRGELFRSPIQPMISLFFLLIGWIPAKIHMRFINDAYLRRGSLRPAKK